MMRKMVFAAMASLAVMFGGFAAASAAPHVGDGNSLGKDASPYFYNYNVAGG